MLSSLRVFMHCTTYPRPLFVLPSIATLKYNSSRLRRKPLALGRLAGPMEKQPDLAKLTFPKYLTAVRLYDQKNLNKSMDYCQ